MRNKIIFLLAVALIAGCQREEMRETLRYSAVTEGFDNTRTSLDEDNRVLWSEEDMVAIFENNDKPSGYQITSSSAGQPSAEFVLMQQAQKGTAVGADVAVYPYDESLTLSRMSTGIYRVNGLSLPEVQQYAGASFGPGAFPMIAVSEAGSGRLAFKNVCGVLRLYLTGNDAVRSITVNGNDGELLSGPIVMNADPDGLPYISAGSDASGEARLDCGAEGVMLDETSPTPFSIVLPPVSFSKGFTVTVRSVDGAEMTVRTDKENPIRRSGVLNMPSVAFAPSYDGVMRVEIEALSMRFDGIDIRVTATNTAEYCGGYELKKDFDPAKVLRSANWKNVTRYKGSCMYEGPLNAFPGGQQDGTLAAGQTYVVWVAPYAEGVKLLKEEDLVYKEFTVPEIKDGGSVKVSAVDYSAGLKSMEVTLSAPGASVIYAMLLTKKEYSGLNSDKAMAEYLIRNSNPAAGSEMILQRTGLNPGEQVYLLALAVDGNGRYGAILNKGYTVAVPVYNDDIAINLDVTYEGKTAKVKVTASGADIAGYYYFHGKTSSSSWTRILGGTRESAELYLAVNNDNYIISNTEEDPFVNGNIEISGLEMGVEHVVVVMAYDVDGRFSRAVMRKFTPQLDLGDFVYKSGATKELWQKSQPSVTFGDCNESGEFYTINWAVTPAEGMTAYAVCAHPNSMEGYSDPKDQAIRIYNLGDVVEPGKMVNIIYGDKGNLVYVIWKDRNGNFYEAYSVAVPQN